MLLLVPEHDFGLFVAGNGSGAGSLIDETVTAVFASLFAAPGGPERQGETPGIAHDAAAAQPAFSGTYRLNRYPRRGPAKLSALFMETRVKVSEDGRTVTLLSTPVSKRSPLTAFLRPDGLYQSPEGGELIAFSDPAASGGRSAHMFVGQWAYDRLAWYETGTTWFAAFGACAVAFVVTIAAGLRRALATLRQRSRRRYSMFVSALAETQPAEPGARRADVCDRSGDTGDDGLGAGGNSPVAGRGHTARGQPRVGGGDRALPGGRLGVPGSGGIRVCAAEGTQGIRTRTCVCLQIQ